MSTLTLSNIAKCYPNGYQAIQKLNLNICDGEMVVLVGRVAAVNPPYFA